MKTSAAAFLVLLLLISTTGGNTAHATLGQHLRGRLKSMLIQSAATEASLRKLSSTCDKSAMYCNSLELDSLIDEFAERRGFVEEKFAPINGLLVELENAKDSIANANQLRTITAIALKLAANIPYVGVVFNVANNLIGPLETPMKALAKTTSSATKSLVTPWSNSVGRIDAVTATVQEKIEVVVNELVSGDRNSGLASLLEGGKCLQPTLNTLTGAFNPFVNSVNTSVNDLTIALREMTGVYRSIATTLESNAWIKSWSKTKSGIKNVIGAINLIATRLNALKPLGDLLKKKISINWPKLKFKKTYGVPKYCPSGYSKSKSQLYCLKDCRSGYGSDGVGFCWKNCDNGYKSATKVACKNKNHYIRKTKGRKLKCSWSKGCSYSCDSGYKSSAYGLTCWENCKSGWKSGHALAVAFCYKSCPSGFKLDPTRALCIRNTYNQASKPMICGSGKESIAGVCSDKCPSGWKDNKLFCSKKSKLSFAIQDIADELGKIIDKIEGLPIVKEIKETIQKLVMKIMDPILAALDLPTVSDLTQKINVGNIKLLKPLNNLAGLLEGAGRKIDKVADALQLPGVDFVEKQKLALVKAMGLPTDLFSDMDKLNDCMSDLSCLSKKLPGVDLPIPSLDGVKSAFGKFSAAFDSDEFETVTQSLLKAFDSQTMSCDKEETIKVPVEKTIADLLGKTAGSQTPCSFDVTYCSQPNFGSDLQPILGSLRTLMSPAIAQVSSLLPDTNVAGPHASLLEGASSGNGVNKDNFAIPFFILPIPGYGFRTDGVTMKDVWGLLWTGKGKGVLTGTSIKTALGPSFVTLYAGKKQGKDYISMDMRFKWEVFRLEMARDHPKSVVQEEMNKFETYLNSVETDASMGASHCFLVKNLFNADCKKLRDALKTFRDSDKWKWDSVPHGVGSYRSWPGIMKKLETDKYWKTTDGKIDVRRVIAYMNRSTKAVQLLLAKITKTKLTWMNKRSPSMKAAAKAQMIRTLHSIPLRWTLPKDTRNGVAIPSIGAQIVSWKHGGAGLEVWKALTQLDAFDRLKLYLPVKAKYVSPHFKGVAADVSLIAGVRVSLGWNVDN